MANLYTSPSPCVVPLSAQPVVEPSSGYGGLSRPQGQEDHSACLRASVWALLPGLGLALVLAQHAL